MEKKKSRGKEGKLFSRDVILIYIYIYYIHAQRLVFFRERKNKELLSSRIPPVCWLGSLSIEVHEVGRCGEKSGRKIEGFPR